jgi:hypothetical protein
MEKEGYMWKEERPVRWDDITIGDLVCIVVLIAMIILVGLLDNPNDYYLR